MCLQQVERVVSGAGKSSADPIPGAFAASWLGVSLNAGCFAPCGSRKKRTKLLYQFHTLTLFTYNICEYSKLGFFCTRLESGEKGENPCLEIR